jgi:ABC-type nitrate/sulfonate/bicarbonate transport system, permease component
MKTLRSAFFFFALPVALVLIWWAATISSTNFFVPKPGQLVETFAQVWVGDRFFSDVAPSLGRLFLGLLIAIVIGIVLGLLVGSSKILRTILEPVLEFLRALPPPVLVPVLMLILGIDDNMKVTVIAFGCVWPVLLNAIEGVRSVDTVLAETTLSFGIRGLSRWRFLILPGAAPRIVTGVRQAVSIGLILMVISEMFASSSGLGFVIVQFQRSFAVPEMWSGIALLGLIGLALAFVFQFVERRVLAWYYGIREVENAG